MEKILFGNFEGRNVHSYSMTNINGMSIKVMEYGATLLSVNVPTKNGQMENLVLGESTSIFPWSSVLINYGASFWRRNPRDYVGVYVKWVESGLGLGSRPQNRILKTSRSENWIRIPDQRWAKMKILFRENENLFCRTKRKRNFRPPLLRNQKLVGWLKFGLRSGESRHVG